MELSRSRCEYGSEDDHEGANELGKVSPNQWGAISIMASTRCLIWSRISRTFSAD